MKFDKFAKKVGADGTIYSMNLNGEVVNFLASPYDNLMARIPEDKQIVAFKKLDMPKPLRDIIMEAVNDEYNRCESANLVQCIAPFADCKQKDLLRVYKSDDLVFKGTISDSEYSFFEDGDTKLLHTGLKKKWKTPEEMSINLKCAYMIIKEKVPYTDKTTVTALIRTQEGKNNGI